MHQLIRVVVEAYNAEDATGIVNGMLDGTDPALIPPYDYGTTLNNSSARFRDGKSEQILDWGAIEATSEEGRELIESGWESTLDKLQRDLAVIKAGLDQFDDEEILDDPKIEDVDVEEYTGILGEEQDTTGGFVRHAMSTFGEYSGPNYYLYDEWGSAIRTPSDYERIQDDIEEGVEDDDLAFYVVPVDVHY